MSAFHRVLICLLTFALALICAGPAWALEPDQIALVINGDVPASRRLAEFYASKRGIPENRIIALSLGNPNEASPPEDIRPTDFDEKVLPPVRDFLSHNNLKDKVTCLVTFWGVPLRVGRRTQAESEKKELEALKQESEQAKTRLEQQTHAAEALALDVDSTFKAAKETDLDGLARRAETAMNVVLRGLPKIADPAVHSQTFEKFMVLLRDFGGEPAVAEKLSQPDFWPLAPTKPSTGQIIEARKHAAELQQKLHELQAGANDPGARQQLRDLVKSDFGTINWVRVIFVQMRAEETAESEAALDSELALLWWDPYPKSRWVLNPLNHHVAGHVALPSHTLMVMRLDGQSEKQVHDLIETSLKIEEAGLTGEVVLDARGKPPTEPYGMYDQTIRNLGELLKSKTNLKVVLDNQEPLIRENSEKQIAIYCGWYSLHHYVSPGEFVSGAVGFHIASAEMVSLHNAGDTGWAPNLLKAGVTGTVGPVAEPYLQSFPPADEFFPLLMTGKLSLAEVYWKTSPWASWMQCCVGDPLYRPYKTNPPLKPQDLPESLRALVP